MVVLKDNPVGVDVPIQVLQEELYEYLLREWDLPPDQFNFYGRAYRNQKKTPDEGYVPEVFIGGRDYKDAYLDDKVAVTAFFVNPELTRHDASNGQAVANTALIFSVNLEKLPQVGHRGDEEAQALVFRYLTDRAYGFSLTEKVTGIQNVFAEYSGYRNRSEIKFRDMHPWYHFRFNMQLIYDINNCTTNLFSK